MNQKFGGAWPVHINVTTKRGQKEQIPTNPYYFVVKMETKKCTN